MVNIYITSVNGQLVAEVNGVKYYELCDVIQDLGFSFGETIEITVDGDTELAEDEQVDVWMLTDMLYAMHDAMSMIPEK